MSKRLGVLTSGGDCAGLNAVIRAIVLRAENLGWEVFGIHDGTKGLMERPPRTMPLSVASMPDDLIRKAGTVLGTTNRGDPFATPSPDGVQDLSGIVCEGYDMLKLDALIGIGGDGSFAILRRLAQQGGWNLVGIPKTIDNDVSNTEVAIGYNTAVEVATDALDNLQPTAASHSRVMILEVMGRDAGHIALNAGLAGGADIILIPEIPYRVETIVDHLHGIQTRGRNYALMVVAEAVRTEEGKPVARLDEGKTRYGGIAHYLADRIAERSGAEVRVTVLGHVQRGAQPSTTDRVMASIFGVHAVDLVAAGKFDRMVAWSNRGVVDVPLEQVVRSAHAVDPRGELVHTARALGVCLGDEAA